MVLNQTLICGTQSLPISTSSFDHPAVISGTNIAFNPTNNSCAHNLLNALTFSDSSNISGTPVFLSTTATSVECMSVTSSTQHSMNSTSVVGDHISSSRAHVVVNHTVGSGTHTVVNPVSLIDCLITSLRTHVIPNATVSFRTQSFPIQTSFVDHPTAISGTCALQNPTAVPHSHTVSNPTNFGDCLTTSSRGTDAVPNLTLSSVNHTVFTDNTHLDSSRPVSNDDAFVEIRASDLSALTDAVDLSQHSQQIDVNRNVNSDSVILDLSCQSTCSVLCTAADRHQTMDLEVDDTVSLEQPVNLSYALASNRHDLHDTDELITDT